ncbi:helix-turn-helix domain-containing protein [Streptomyces olivaceus]|uniref:helix-turn-helix domain-containing protein n=1 Tax=Streptomyces olivaceus TaxID=47716 RepID=UPI001CC93F06|nr:helix-turn-helix domain-containing protein [Streptomyces olivaceus]MBZ6286389.1 helix-turn-helix domain-containing protein [Streptomyces olivaceus]
MTRSPATPLPPPKARRRLREGAALTQTQLASRVNVTRATIRAWESGRTAPRGRKREAYARLLKTLAEEDAAQGTRSAPPPEPAPAPEPTPVIEPVSGPASDTASDPVSDPVSGPEEGSEPEPGSGLEPESGSEPEPVPEPAPEHPVLTPAQAFDALYEFSAPALVRQAYLLTGRRELARESVERAFQTAWERWPEVARDRDPVGWVRAAAYEFALSPWQRFRPRHRQPEPPPADPGDRTLLNALLRLGPQHRRTLVLYDGVGLDLPETAAETEASTPAAANRLLHARETVAGRLPALADSRVLHQRLTELASAERLWAAKPTGVRKGGERRARFRTRAAIAFTVALIGATALTVRTAPTHYEPAVSPGVAVRGVPPRVAPGSLSEAERELRQKLRDRLQDGPERLEPRLE